MRISDWSSDVCSSDLKIRAYLPHGYKPALREDEMPSCPAGAKGAGSYSMFYNGFLYSVRGLQSPNRSEKAYADAHALLFTERLEYAGGNDKYHVVIIALGQIRNCIIIKTEARRGGKMVVRSVKIRGVELK